MPLTKWCVEPVFLSRKPIPPDKTRINELESNANNTLVGILRQLSSLVQISDKIFNELSEDCRQIFERTLTLKFKVDRCESVINQLNAKSVKVPVGNLNAFIQIEHHFKSNKELSNNLFTTDSRPLCIKDAYLAASQTPLHIIRAIDSCRDDGRCGSKLFICQPVFADSKKKVNFDIETRRPASLVFAHELPRNVILERAKTPLCNSHNVVLTNKQEDNSTRTTVNNNRNINNNSNRISIYENVGESEFQQNPLYGLISPEEQMKVISREYPSKYVPIDVTGVGFNRMSNLRRSLIHADFLIRRKKSTASKGKRVKRRNTICQSSNELSLNGNNQNRRSRVRRRSAGSIDFVHTSCQTEINENEIYSSGRIVEVKKSKNMAIDSMTNTKNESNNNNNETFDNYNRENKIKLKAEIHHYVSGSLDDLIDTNRKHKSIGSDMPEIIDSNESDRNQTNNNEMTDKCKDQNSNPISSLSVAMSNAVKMRESLAAKGVGDDGRSSSGNWSASSSTHASVDSDHMVNGTQSIKTDLPHTLSNSSIGKDSVISDSNTTHHENDGRLSSQENTSYSSDTSNFNTLKSNPKRLQTEPKTLESSVNSNVVIRTNNSELGNKVQYANRDSESWLQYYDSSDTITPTPTESESGQTNQAVTSCSGSSRRSSYSAIGRQSNDDEAESVYSVDNDGYYTSMHTDSGLFRVPVKLMITPNSSFRCKGKRDSIASVSTVGDISINSILSKTETESSTTTLTNNSCSSGRIKLPPPPPPPRISSMLRSIRNSTISQSGSDNGTTASNTSTSSRSHSPSPTATITSESEHSDVAKNSFRAKTNFDSSSYPSMCAITSTENSDDCKSADSYSSDGSNRVTPTWKMMRSRSGSYKGFRIKDIFGFGNSAKEERSSPLTVPTVPHIATIRRPQSPLRFNRGINMYNGEGGNRVRRFAEKINSNLATTPNIIRANAISSFSSDSNECSNELNNSSTNNSKSSSAIKTANTDKISDTSETSDTQLTASKTVPNPNPNPNSNSNVNSKANLKPSSSNENTSKVPHTMLYPISRQVSIPIPRNDWKPLISAKPTTTSSISRPTTLSIPVSNANRSVARVTLDANGCVIYASNSLGRRRDGHPMNYLNQIQKTPVKIQEEQRCATLPMAYKPRVSSPLSPTTKPGALVHINSNGYIECINSAKKNIKTQSSQPTLSPNKTSNGQIHAINSMSNKSHSPNSAPVSRCVTPVVNKQRTRPTTPANGLNTTNEETGHKSPASVSFSSKKQFMESDLNAFVPNSTSSPITPLTPKDNNKESSPSSTESETTSTLQRRGRLTTEDLLIIIHSSKKKHNIKTEPEIIIANSPPSTRSHSSNSSSSPGSINQQLLSPPNTPSRTANQLNGNSDRRSWNGSESSPNCNLTQAGSRRSLASDRLGSNRPTTMNDFKRLLSQTRSNNFNSDRLSAAEILRANSKRPLTPVINCITSFVGNNNSKSSTPVTPSRISPFVTHTPPPQIINGSISINTPNIIKPRIINGRSTRSPYRLESVCPPILEDCSEETDDKKSANAVKQQKLYPSKVQTPVINNYSKVAANPKSTSTWV